MIRELEQLLKPRIGLVHHKEYKDARKYFEEIKDAFFANGAKFNLANMAFTLPNGNKLIIGYGELEKFISCEFLFVIGCDELQYRVRI